ncbi:MAG: hypothetical protein ABIK37_03745 [candidate division WOR-3 bacterium]
MRKAFVVVALGLGLAFGEAAKVVQRTVRRAVVVPTGVVLSLSHRFGGLAVTGTDGDSCILEARIVVSGRSTVQVRRLAEKVDVMVRLKPETLEAVTIYPGTPAQDSSLSCEVDLNVRAPELAPLSVSNAFGDILLRGMKEMCWAAVRYGRLDLSGCGSAELSGRHGNISVFDLQGSLVIENDFGDVLLRGVRGEVRIANRYGHVEVRRTGGAVRIENGFGSVECRQDSGTLSVDNRLGNVRVWFDGVRLKTLSLVSRVGRIELNVQSGANCRLRGLVRRGTILAGLPLQVVEEGGWRRIEGLVGNGGSEIEFLTYDGDVVVRTETTDDSLPGDAR